jgi:hypothetical protein
MTILLLLALVQKVDPRAVDEAVDRGARGLLAVNLPGEVNYNVGGEHTFDELVLYTLIHAGVDYNEATFKKLLAKAVTAPLKRTYQVSLVAMSLYALDPAKYQERIAECAQWLVDSQCTNGQWDYGVKYDIPKPVPTDGRKDVASGGGENPPKRAGTLAKYTIKKSRDGNAVGDNSNTQYAAMGVRACALSGCEIEKKVSERAIEWWEKSQLEDGSWNYCFQGFVKKEEAGYGSMTTGGVASLLIWNKILGRDGKGTKSVKSGLDWLAKNFTVTENPKEPGSPKRWHFYYLYAMERVGDLAPLDKIGAHDWYATGAEWLLKNQGGGGMWAGGVRDFNVADTCFAILFLRKATKQPPKVATGK